MSTIFAIIRKDISHFRLLFITWLFFLFFATYVETFNFKGSYEIWLIASAKEGLFFLLRALRWMIPFFVVIPIVTHDNSLNLPNSFWHTRPISRLQLFLSKFSLLFIFVVLLPAFSETFMLVCKGVPQNEVFGTLFDVLLRELLILVVAFLLSAVTVDFYQFIMVLFLFVGTFVIGAICSFAMRSLFLVSTNGFLNTNFDSSLLSKLFSFHISPVILDSLIVPLIFGLCAYIQYLYGKRLLTALSLSALIIFYVSVVFKQDYSSTLISNQAEAPQAISGSISAKIVDVSFPNQPSNDESIREVEIKISLNEFPDKMAMKEISAKARFHLDDDSIVELNDGWIAREAPSSVLISKRGIENFLTERFKNNVKVNFKDPQYYKIVFTGSAQDIARIKSKAKLKSIQLVVKGVTFDEYFSTKLDMNTVYEDYPYHYTVVPFSTNTLQGQFSQSILGINERYFTRSRIEEEIYQKGDEEISIAVNTTTNEATLLSRKTICTSGITNSFVTEVFEIFKPSINEKAINIDQNWIRNSSFIRLRSVGDKINEPVYEIFAGDKLP